MRITVELTLNEETARKFKETADRLTALDLGEDGVLAAVVLNSIARDYERAAQTRAAASQHGPASQSGVEKTGEAAPASAAASPDNDAERKRRHEVVGDGKRLSRATVKPPNIPWLK